MRYFPSFVILCTLLFASCNQTSKQESLSEIPDKMTANQKWMQAINTKNIDLLSSLYTENALVLSKNGVDLPNRNEILELVPNSDFVVKSVSTKKRIKATDIYDYEIGSFTNKDGGLMKHIIIWKTLDGIDVRELEFLAEVSDVKVDMKEIDNQRKKWMNLCNAHDAKSLIENVYSENTMYYNRGRLLEGRSDLIKEYAYMNNPQYSLALKPILVEPVSDTIVYEFGQCQGSYNGKYILVWHKNNQGVWQVLFDSNI